ncbi:MAG: regulatory protein RecX, partial [Eubacteriales bacterium]|nr:regulatory protein RecX [Eubacteriales bacterium]
MLDKRDYACLELLEKLVEKGESREDAEAAVERLTELGFLNDRRYAGLVARHYAAKGCGRKRIESELFRRRVPRELWDEALEEVPPSDDVLDTLL